MCLRETIILLNNGQWLTEIFLKYLEEWEHEAANINKSQQQKLCLSKESLLGLRITGMNEYKIQLSIIIMHKHYTVNSFTELAPTLLRVPGVKYVLSEVFSQDPLERHFLSSGTMKIRPWNRCN